MTPFAFTHEGEHYSLAITFDYSPSTPDVMYLSNGDPGHPGDPEELDITQVSFINSIRNKIDLPSEFLDDFALLERMEVLCREHLDSLTPDEPDYPDDQPDDSGPF